ncbi:MAG: hypothetical protein L3J37_05560 [Rhodobacteraceae bacterium]|nr:hypothetical protein [Paracoccaceae bacterium]
MLRARISLLVAASIFIPSVAFAQLSVCGVSPAEVQPFGGFGVDVTTLDAPAQMQVQLTPGVSNYLQFEVSSPTDVRIEATDDSGVDPVMVLLDTSGNELASDDDGGGRRASRIETSLQPGSYCAKVYNFSSNNGPTTLQLSRWDMEPVTTGGTAGGGGVEACTASTPASPLVSSGPLNAALAGGEQIRFTRDGNVTYHRFTVDNPLALTITAQNTDADPVVRVYDNAGNLVAENDDFDGLNAQIDMQTPLQPGDYCIAVSALSDGAQPIDVEVRKFDEKAFLYARYATGKASPPIGGDFPIDDIGLLTSTFSGDVLVGKDARWILFEVAEPSLVLIQGIGNGGADSQLYLYNDRGQQLGFNDDSGIGGASTRDSQIAAELYPGRYLAAVLLFGYEDGAASEPVRVSLQRYVRPPK